MIIKKLGASINSVTKGSLLVALIHATLTTVIGLSFFGIPNSLLWGVLAFITSLVPGIGAAIVQIPGVIYLFVTGHVAAAVGLLAWGAIVAISVDNILRPKLIGYELQIPPLLVLLSVLGGILFFGPVGIFLGPLTISFLFTFSSVYKEISKKS